MDFYIAKTQGKNWPHVIIDEIYTGVRIAVDKEIAKVNNQFTDAARNKSMDSDDFDLTSMLIE